jgi:tRNA 2-thiouridine synthesizing protein E
MKIGEQTYEFDGDGFLQEPERWSEEVANALAAEEDIEEMTQQHWGVVNFIRKYWQENDIAPPVRLLCKECGVSVRELYRLFKSGPARGACRIAGLPKPDGCV